jgi:hypothetical protein
MAGMVVCMAALDFMAGTPDSMADSMALIIKQYIQFIILLI